MDRGRVTGRLAALVAVVAALAFWTAAPAQTSKKVQRSAQSRQSHHFKQLAPLHGVISVDWQASGTRTTTDASGTLANSYDGHLSLRVSVDGTAGEKNGYYWQRGDVQLDFREHAHQVMTPKQGPEMTIDETVELVGPAEPLGIPGDGKATSVLNGQLYPDGKEATLLLDVRARIRTTTRISGPVRPGTEVKESSFGFRLSSGHETSDRDPFHAPAVTQGSDISLDGHLSEATIGRWGTAYASFIASGPARDMVARLAEMGPLFPSAPWEGTISISWHLTTRDLELVADPGGPYEVERAQWVTLDGSNSKGGIDSWEWTFEPDPEESEAPPVAEVDDLDPVGRFGGPSPYSFNAAAAGGKTSKKYGKQVKIQVLGGVTATLKVSSKGKSHSKKTHVDIRARGWKTSFDTEPKEDTFEKSELWFGCMGGNYGRNVCAEDHDQEHWFHPGGPTWDGIETGFMVARLIDPGGPYDGRFFVSHQGLEIWRTVMINAELLSGAIPKKNASDAAHAADLKAFINSVRMHERLHSILAERALRADDPAVKIEAMSGPDESQLIKAANDAIRAAEIRVNLESSPADFPDEMRKAGVKGGGSVFFPEGRERRVWFDCAISSFADYGVDGHRQ